MAVFKSKPLPPITEKVVQRFWEKVTILGLDECWSWTACTQKNYGVLRIGVRYVKSSRLSYFIQHGKDPYPWDILHHCDNPPCCNPRHFFLGTNTENTADMVKKGRQAKGDRSAAHSRPEIMARGERHPRHKYKDAQVLEIKKLLQLKQHTHRVIAQMTGVDKQFVSRLSYGNTRRHIIPEPLTPQIEEVSPLLIEIVGT